MPAKPRGRHAAQTQAEPTTQWLIRLPESLATAVDQTIYDPLRGRVRYGARQQLVESLLRKYLGETPQNPLDSFD